MQVYTHSQLHRLPSRHLQGLSLQHNLPCMSDRHILECNGRHHMQLLPSHHIYPRSRSARPCFCLPAPVRCQCLCLPAPVRVSMREGRSLTTHDPHTHHPHRLCRCHLADPVRVRCRIHPATSGRKTRRRGHELRSLPSRILQRFRGRRGL
jgi:hypothetical protein